MGIGLERIPWLINGTASSYEEVFGSALVFLKEKVEINMNSEIWEKFGPYATLLNVDEADDIVKVWSDIAGHIGITSEVLQAALNPVRELYVLLDHTRSIFMAIYDGSLPSNVGGGSNIRNLVRRTFAILKKNGWFEKIGGIEGYLTLLDCHKTDLG